MLSAFFRKRLFFYVLLVMGMVLFGLIGGSAPTAAQPTIVTARLVNTIDTAQWQPPSPDPSGITYWPDHDTLVVVDGEVEEMTIYSGFNVFESTRTGSLVDVGTTTSFSNEPVGIDIAINPGNDHFFISDDSKDRIFEVAVGFDDRIGTSDDTVTSFSTAAFGSGDPEGLTFAAESGGIKLFIIDGAGKRVYKLDSGSDGIFNGVPPSGDDHVSSFDVEGLGIRDPEGIEFNPAAGTLYVIDRRGDISEITTSGQLVRVISIGFLNADNPSDVTLAPSTENPSVNNLFLTDRRVDNNNDPNENDGKIYELALESAPPPESRLANASFEEDANGDSYPDSWDTNSNFTRSADVAHEGSYSGKHFATNGASYKINQRVAPVAAGATYNASCWVNIPADGGFTFKLQVLWRNSSNRNIGRVTLESYRSETNGWEQASATMVAPDTAAKADFRMVVKNLDTTIYIDDCSFGRQ